MSQGGEGKGERGFEVQTMISVQNHFEKNKILHSDQFSLGPGSAVGEKLKREKIGELSGSLAGLGKKGPRDLFMPFHTIFSPQRSLVRVRSALINNSCAAGSQQTRLP